MRMNMREANAWRRDRVDALVAALKGDDHEATERAMMGMDIPGGGPAVGFSVGDLRYQTARLIDRVDYLETVRARKESALRRIEGAAERREERAERLEGKAARVGGTVPGEEYRKVRDIAKAAREEAEGVRNKLAGIEASVGDLAVTIEALMGAYVSIKAIIDRRTTPAVEAERTQGVLVASA